MIAGLVATIVLSAIMLMKSAMGLMPQLNVIQMLNQMAGMPNMPVVGWVIHFLIGTVAWGILFALLTGVLPGAYWLKGVIFGIIAWLLMMILLMPMAGAGLFGMQLGIAAPIMTLMLHIIYGAVLGFTYAKLPSKGAAPSRIGKSSRGST